MAYKLKQRDPNSYTHQ